MNQLREKLLTQFKDREFAHTYSREFLNLYIATQIKVVREQRGMSQSELATQAGMKQTRISVLEDVNYDAWTISTLKRIADALDVTLKVSFESYGPSISEIAKFSRESLQREARENSLAELQRSTLEGQQAMVFDIGALGGRRNQQPPSQKAPPTPFATTALQIASAEGSAGMFNAHPEPTTAAGAGML